MRMIAFVKTTPTEESQDAGPTTEQLAAVGRFNEEMQEAGVLVGGEGLLPTAAGSRVRVTTGSVDVEQGPFTDSPDLVAGWWLLEVRSQQEAVDWLSRYPAGLGESAEFELRTIATAEDFGDALSPDLREAEDRLREQVAAS